MFKVIGFIVGFMLTTITIYLFGFDFDQRGDKLGFWFIFSITFGAVGCLFASTIYDKRN